MGRGGRRDRGSSPLGSRSRGESNGSHRTHDCSLRCRLGRDQSPSQRLGESARSGGARTGQVWRAGGELRSADPLASRRILRWYTPAGTGTSRRHRYRWRRWNAGASTNPEAVEGCVAWASRSWREGRIRLVRLQPDRSGRLTPMPDLPYEIVRRVFKLRPTERRSGRATQGPASSDGRRCGAPRRPLHPRRRLDRTARADPQPLRAPRSVRPRGAGSRVRGIPGRHPELSRHPRFGRELRPSVPRRVGRRSRHASRGCASSRSTPDASPRSALPIWDTCSSHCRRSRRPTCSAQCCRSHRPTPTTSCGPMAVSRWPPHSAGPPAANRNDVSLRGMFAGRRDRKNVRRRVCRPRSCTPTPRRPRPVWASSRTGGRIPMPTPRSGPRKTSALGSTRIDCPVLVQSGWYDLLLESSIDQYERLAARGADVRLTVGPWTHATFTSRGFGRVLAETAAFLHAANGTGPELTTPPVRLLDARSSALRELASWPPPHEAEHHYLAPGRLQRELRRHERARDFVHLRPEVANTAGRRSAARTGRRPCRQRDLERRDDVITFDTPPLDRSRRVHRYAHRRAVDHGRRAGPAVVRPPQCGRRRRHLHEHHGHPDRCRRDRCRRRNRLRPPDARHGDVAPDVGADRGGRTCPAARRRRSVPPVRTKPRNGGVPGHGAPTSASPGSRSATTPTTRAD